jgi:hypothetical protein
MVAYLVTDVARGGVFRACSVTFAFAAIAVFAQVVQADASPAESLSNQASDCHVSIVIWQARLEQAVFWSNVLMIAGAIVSATGAGLAAFLNKKAQRRAAAVVGAIGALLTVLPKALPDKADLQGKLAAADKHRTIAEKVVNQFRFGAPTEDDRVEAEKYASARYTDCVALNPPASVPDLPAFASFRVAQKAAEPPGTSPTLSMSVAPDKELQPKGTVPPGAQRSKSLTASSAATKPPVATPQ